MGLEGSPSDRRQRNFGTVRASGDRHWRSRLRPPRPAPARVYLALPLSAGSTLLAIRMIRSAGAFGNAGAYAVLHVATVAVLALPPIVGLVVPQARGEGPLMDLDTPSAGSVSARTENGGGGTTPWERNDRQRLLGFRSPLVPISPSVSVKVRLQGLHVSDPAGRRRLAPAGRRLNRLHNPVRSVKPLPLLRPGLAGWRLAVELRAQRW